jgi:uracil phosphoribosyltransferase
LGAVYTRREEPSRVENHFGGYNKVTPAEVSVTNVFASKHPLVAHKLARLRDMKTDPKRFRELVREIAALLAYEATADLVTIPRPVQTPLAAANGVELQEKIGLVPILRAGLGMVEGVWELMPTAEVWHIGLYRDEHTLQPVEYYNKLPVEPTVSVCLILDPMLATGGSAVAAADVLKRWGVGRIKFVGVIGAPEGIRNMQEHHPDVPIYLAAIDDHLNERGYIVPGLGDAGDRQFGTG